MNRERLLSIIKAPLVTEKSSMLASKLNQVVFKVSLDANKTEIKKAVESLFDVKVAAVTTAISKGKTKRNKFGKYKRSDYKKAIVALEEGSKIQFEGIN
ncbi:MAG: 50S ribosomal protein L23 [Gammaproteobacteria bacterium]